MYNTARHKNDLCVIYYLISIQFQSKNLAKRKKVIALHTNVVEKDAKVKRLEHDLRKKSTRLDNLIVRSIVNN